MRSSQSPSILREERTRQQELYERERYIIPDKYAPSSPARPRSPHKETVRLATGSLAHGIEFRPTGGHAKIPEVPPPLPQSPYKYNETSKPHKEITPSKVRKARSPTRKSLNTSAERSISQVMREAEELIAATKIKSKSKNKSTSLSPGPAKTKPSSKRRSKSTSSVNRSYTSVDSIKESKPAATKKAKPIKKKKKTKSVTAMALKREVNKILKEIANETNQWNH